MAQLVVLINNKDYISPNLCLTCLYIICYSRIYKVLDLFIVGDLVVLSLSNTQMTCVRKGDYKPCLLSFVHGSVSCLNE